MEYENFRKEFIKYNKLFAIPENEIEKFYQYMKLLLEWNEKINLTAITDESEIIRKHFIDSLTISKLIKEDTNVVDVGTGAGFPGMPLAITKKVKVTLVDSLNKRINFLNIVKEAIELDNVNTVHGRAEEVGQNEKYREKFDYAVSRAVAPINVLLEYMLPLVKVGGYCLCMKGPKVIDEMQGIENVAEKLGGKYIKLEELEIPGEESRKNVIIIKKVESTNKKFCERVYTEKEREYCESKKMQKYQHYAARFSAKEAVFKAVSDELENKFQINWKDIEILNDEKGRPYVNILNNKIQNIEDIDISLSHCKEYAIANVVVIFK